jgi:hypothetical protein
MPKPPTKRQPLTYEQIDLLARNIAIDLTNHEETARPLMLLMSEAANFREQGETVATLLLSYLFSWQRASSDAAHEYVEKYRQQFLAKHGGKS